MGVPPPAQEEAEEIAAAALLAESAIVCLVSAGGFGFGRSLEGVWWEGKDSNETQNERTTIDRPRKHFALSHTMCICGLKHVAEIQRRFQTERENIPSLMMMM